MSTADVETFLAAHCLGSTLHDGRADGESTANLLERHTAAIEVCAGCPCATSCAALHRTLPRSARAFGVWAGKSADLRTLTTTKETDS